MEPEDSRFRAGLSVAAEICQNHALFLADEAANRAATQSQWLILMGGAVAAGECVRLIKEALKNLQTRVG